MKTIITFIIIINSYALLFSQENTLYVKYSYDYVSEDSDEVFYADLTHSNNVSQFIIHKKEFDPATVSFDENDNIKGVLREFKDETYKLFDENIYYAYSNLIYQRKTILKDSLNQLNWKINNANHKKILDYDCIEAETLHKGRKYIAYFSPDIPIFDGPWKFSGLPGLILELYEENNLIFFQAIELRITEGISNFKTSLDIKNAKYFDEILGLSKKRYIEEKNKMRLCCSSNPHIDTTGSLEIYDINE